MDPLLEQLLIDHMKSEPVWQSNIERRLDKIEGKLSFWRGTVVGVSAVISMIITLFVAWWER